MSAEDTERTEDQRANAKEYGERGRRSRSRSVRREGRETELTRSDLL
jgi:hypothetical protein